MPLGFSARSAEHWMSYPVESMVDQMGKSAVTNFTLIAWIRTESHLQKPKRRCCSSWQIVIVDGSEQNLAAWHRFTKARALRRLPMLRSTGAEFLREKPNLKCRIMPFRCASNAFFQPAPEFTGCIKPLRYLAYIDRAGPGWGWSSASGPHPYLELT